MIQIDTIITLCVHTAPFYITFALIYAVVCIYYDHNFGYLYKKYGRKQNDKRR